MTLIKQIVFLSNFYLFFSSHIFLMMYASKGMLKLLSYEISYPLSIVFQRILDEGQCPTIWKLDNIIPIFKNVIIHFHQIIVQSVYCHPLSLFLKKILSYYLLYYLRYNKLLCTEQYGFLPGRSTELQLIEFNRNISRSTNHSFNTDIIYIYIYIYIYRYG